jgi:hypothetical protein
MVGNIWCSEVTISFNYTCSRSIMIVIMIVMGGSSGSCRGTCRGVYMYAQWSGDKIPIIGNIRLGLEIYTQKRNSNVLHRDPLYVQDAPGKWEAMCGKIVIVSRQSNKLNKTVHVNVTLAWSDKDPYDFSQIKYMAQNVRLGMR